jgi:DeoR family transcriptional regulator, fructose operon transcriptional repressor
MMMALRQSRLQEIIARHGMIDLDSLCRELGVSDSTVRRDVTELEKKGLVRRTHGGVVWVSETNTGRPYAFTARMQYKVEAKQRIAAAARKLVDPGETILLDGGTTTFYLAEQLLGTQLQLVTNSLPIASLFQNDEAVELILVGGVMYPRYGVLLGPTAESMLDGIHTKTLFMSVAGIDRGMLYNQNMLLVQTERKMMQRAQKIVLMIDSSKFGQQALVQLGELRQVHTIITDERPPETMLKQIEDAGCELIVA